MPLYQDEEKSKVFTDFGDGSSLTIYLKEEARGSGALDDIVERHEELSLIQARIEGLKKIVEDSETSAERMKEAHDELKALRPKAQNVNEMVKLIRSVGDGWDNYASREAHQRGEAPVPFTEPNIKRIHPTRLIKIVANIALFMNMDDESGNSPSATSLEPSRKAESALTSIRDGIYDNKTAEPSQSILDVAT